jgi:hypothetical protein
MLFKYLLAPGPFCLLAMGSPAFAASCPLEPPNLVRNASFECDGINAPKLIVPITGWKVAGGNIGETSSFDPILASNIKPLNPYPSHSSYLAICTQGSVGTVSQNISTISGHKYIFKFSFSSNGDAGNFFQANWGNEIVMQAKSMLFNTGWVTFNGGAEYDFVVTATSALTKISFQGKGIKGSCIGVDDVSVVPD